MATSTGVAASDKRAATAEGASSASELAVEAKLTTLLPARRSVAELQKVLLANPVAGPPLVKVVRSC